MTHIAVVGSSNTDMIIRLPVLPRPGETVLGGQFRTAGGGKGANQAMAAARAGAPVRLLACVGDDDFGRRALAGLRSAGVDTAACVVDPHAASGIAQILVDQAGENCIAVAPGANECLRPAHITAATPQLMANAALLLLQLETPLDTVRTAIAAGRAVGAQVLLNPAPAQALPEALYREVDLITPNETEAERLTGIAISDEASAAAAAAQLHILGVGIVIITRGRHGAFVSRQEAKGQQQCESVPAFAVEAVDTTGAGDVFNGTLAAALLERQPLTKAIRFAQAAAALSVQAEGAQSSIPTRAQIDAMLRQYGDGELRADGA